MKPKKLNKKLNLNQKSIANLDSGKMQEVHGGIISGDPCPVYITQTCGFTWCNPIPC